MFVGNSALSIVKSPRAEKRSGGRALDLILVSFRDYHSIRFAVKRALTPKYLLYAAGK